MLLPVPSSLSIRLWASLRLLKSLNYKYYSELLFKEGIRKMAVSTLNKLRDYIKHRSNRLQVSIWAGVALLVLSIFCYVQYDNRNVNSGEICRAIMLLEFGRVSKIESNGNVFSKVSIGNDEYGCVTISGNVSWGKVDGRKRNTEFDPAVTYFLVGRDMYVKSSYPSGSSRKRIAYTLEQ